MLNFLYQNQHYIKKNGQLVVECGIHTMTQFKKIINPYELL